jgi:Uma2 family endonuclease
MQSDRHPDFAVYLDPLPTGGDPWTQWIPHIVAEVVSRRDEERDYVEKREEYLTAGVTEYWILDPTPRTLLVLRRAGNFWQEFLVKEDATYRTLLLPGLEVRPEELFGPAEATQ